MRSTAVLTAALASMAVAQPHVKHHAHRHAHNKRGLATDWVTTWTTVTVTEYIDETTTSWVTPPAKPTPATTPPTVATSNVAGQFFEGASATAPPAAPVNVPATSQAPAVVAPPANTPAAQAPAPSPSPDSAGSASAPGGTTYHGDLTFYTLGLGACGSHDEGKDNTHSMVALSHELMGPLSNGNPMCGKTITIKYGGKTTTAIVVDKCMGCSRSNIDVSEKVFKDLVGDEGKGRVDCEWWFN